MGRRAMLRPLRGHPYHPHSERPSYAVLVPPPLFGDDLFRDAAKGIQVALRSRANELPQ